MSLNHNRRHRKLDRNFDILISYTDFKGPSPVLGYSVSLDSDLDGKRFLGNKPWQGRAGLDLVASNNREDQITIPIVL